MSLSSYGNCHAEGFDTEYSFGSDKFQEQYKEWKNEQKTGESSHSRENGNPKNPPTSAPTGGAKFSDFDMGYKADIPFLKMPDVSWLYSPAPVPTPQYGGFRNPEEQALMESFMELARENEAKKVLIKEKFEQKREAFRQEYWEDLAKMQKSWGSPEGMLEEAGYYLSVVYFLSKKSAGSSLLSLSEDVAKAFPAAYMAKEDAVNSAVKKIQNYGRSADQFFTEEFGDGYINFKAGFKKYGGAWYDSFSENAPEILQDFIAAATFGKVVDYSVGKIGGAAKAFVSKHKLPDGTPKIPNIDEHFKQNTHTTKPFDGSKFKFDEHSAGGNKLNSHYDLKHDKVVTGTEAKFGYRHHAEIDVKLLDRDLEFHDVSKVQKKFEAHKNHFGLKNANYNKANGEMFKNNILEHIKDPDTIPISGTYRSTQKVVHFFNPKTEINVMKDLNGRYLSGWKLAKDQKNLLKIKGNVQ